jgi:hypothetical protein
MYAQVLLHAYALDCASHFIFGKYGTHSLEKGEDERMMRELSFHYSLRRTFPFSSLLKPFISYSFFSYVRRDSN